MRETDRARRVATVGEVEVVRCITSRSDQTGKYFSYNFGVVYSILSLVSSFLISSRLPSSLLFSSLPLPSLLFSSLLFSSRLVSSRLVSYLLFSSLLFSSLLVSSRLVSSRLFSSVIFSSLLFSSLPTMIFVSTCSSRLQPPAPPRTDGSYTFRCCDGGPRIMVASKHEATVGRCSACGLHSDAPPPGANPPERNGTSARKSE